MNKCILSFLLLAITLTASAESVEDQIAMVRQVAAIERLTIVMQNMGLTEAEGQKFWPLYKEYRTAMTKLGDRTLALIEDYAEHSQEMTNEKAREITEEWFEIEQSTLLAKQRYARKFRTVLPELQVARLLQIENKIDAVYKLQLASQIPLMQ